MLNWDCKITRESGAAALYEVWSKDIAKAVLQRVVPASLQSAVGELELNQTVRHLSHPTADSFGANPYKRRNQLLRDTLKAAAERLAKLEGPDSSKWSWGTIACDEVPAYSRSGCRGRRDHGFGPGSEAGR